MVTVLRHVWGVAVPHDRRRVEVQDGELRIFAPHSSVTVKVTAPLHEAFLTCSGRYATIELAQGKVYWAANKSFEISKFKFKFPRARTYDLIRARSRLHRSQNLQVNNSLESSRRDLHNAFLCTVLESISNLNFFVKNRQIVFAIE